MVLLRILRPLIYSTGLQGAGAKFRLQPAADNVTAFDYNNPFVAPMGRLVIVSVTGVLWQWAVIPQRIDVTTFKVVAVGTRIAPRPEQIPACAANAPGSSLGSWRLNDDRAAGVMS